jgi:hypothetical protein
VASTWDKPRNVELTTAWCEVGVFGFQEVTTRAYLENIFKYFFFFAGIDSLRQTATMVCNLVAYYQLFQYQQ